MDHLPYPENPILPPLKTPYLCQDVETYDGQGLKDFPARKGWIMSLQWSARDSARAQSWLYFGLLIELLGQSFNRDEFIDTARDGQQYVTIAKLPALLRVKYQENSPLYMRMASSLGLTDRLRGLPSGLPYVRLTERLASSLKLAGKQSDGQDTGDSLASAIALSIKILIWSIGNATMYVPTFAPSSWERWIHFAPRQSRLLRSRMLESGKCPYWTEIYLRTYSSAMINYLAATTSMDGNTNHESCSTEQCIAHDIDNDQYATKHVNDNCSCDMTAPDIQKVTSIIEKNGVPLIRLKQLPSGDLTLDVVPAHYGLHYTAISHVWSGGLGNPTSNALPQCQLKNIRLKHARNQAHKDLRLSPTPYSWRRQHALDEVFWMDTLCIPPGLEKSLRQKAIAQMNFTYSGADNVLVIDPVLQSITNKSLSELQLGLHIACSPWMTRCWTFLEARLARGLHVHLGTTFYTLPMRRYQNRKLNRSLQVRSLWTDKSELEQEVLSFCGKMWPLVDQDPSYKPSIFVKTEGGDVGEFTKIWNQLNERSTTKRGDRLIILAVLLDLNAGEIMSLNLKEQIRAIFRTQSAVPLSFLFEPQTEPAVDDLKCRWIPLYPKGEISTVYGCMTRNQAESHYQFQLSEIKAFGFLLDAKDSDFSTFFIAQTVPTEANSYTLIYDCPLIYTLVNPSQSLSPTEACPKLEAIVMSETTQVSLDCDLSRWYVPRISRAKSIGIRKRIGLQSLPYLNFIGDLIFGIWALGCVFAIYASCRHPNQTGLRVALYVMACATPVRFLVIYNVLEYPLLSEIIGQRQYYRWATTFSGVDPENFAIVNDSKPLSYQYRPWWLAVLLILGAIALLVTGTRFPVMHAATVPGAVLLVETVLRFGIELLWLRTPLGDIGKRLLLRWLPWYSMPIRQW
ncbi:hypothetical protein MMC22_007790 [Lobaria immixta]|nr:hypothetical protein [Lobaria immixta]